MARNPISSGQNGYLIHLINSNMGIVTIQKWYQNFILDTRIIKNGCLGIFGPNNAETTISYYSSGQNQILRPLIDSNYTHITIKMLSQIFILTTRNWISSHIALYRPKNGKKWYRQQICEVGSIPENA